MTGKSISILSINDEKWQKCYTFKVPGRGAFSRRALLKKDSSAEYQDFTPWQHKGISPGYIAKSVP
jgi:hypothetical protein